MDQYYSHDSTTRPDAKSLVTAAANGQLNAVRQLLREGADVDERGSFAETALHWAAAKGDGRMVDLLIDGGAFVQKYDRQGRSPADVAKYFGHLELSQKLESILRQEPYTRNEVFSRRYTPTSHQSPGA